MDTNFMRDEKERRILAFMDFAMPLLVIGAISSITTMVVLSYSGVL